MSIFALLVCMSFLQATVTLHDHHYTQELINALEHGTPQQIVPLVEQGADVNVRIGSQPLLLKAIDDLAHELMKLEESSLKLWLGRGLLGVGILGICWWGYSKFAARAPAPAPAPVVDDADPVEAEPDSPDPLPNPAPAPINMQLPPPPAPVPQDPVPAVPAPANEAVPLRAAAAQAAGMQAAPSASQQEDSPPAPVRHLQQPPPPARAPEPAPDIRGNSPLPLPPRPAEAQPAAAKKPDDQPTAPPKKPGIWKRFKQKFARKEPVPPAQVLSQSAAQQGVKAAENHMKSLGPIAAFITGLSLVRSGAQRKATSAQLTDRLAAIVALLDIPELDLAELDREGNTAIMRIDEHLEQIARPTSRKILVDLRAAIERALSPD